MKDITKLFLLFDNILKIRFFFLFIFILFATLIEMFSLSLLIPIMNFVYDGGSFTNHYIMKYNLNFLKDFLSINYILIFFIIFYFLKTIYLIFVSHYQINLIFHFF